MTLRDRRIKVLTQALEETIDQQYSIEIKIDVSRSLMIVMAADAEASKKLQAGIAQYEYQLDQAKKFVDMYQRKLEALEKEPNK